MRSNKQPVKQHNLNCNLCLHIYNASAICVQMQAHTRTHILQNTFHGENECDGK